MVGFDVTCDGAPGPALLATTIAGNRLLSMGTKGGCPRGAGFTRYLPGVRLMDAGTKNKGGAGRSLTTPGWKMAKIILAEDDNDMRRFLVKALQNAGYDVISFDNGLSAYQRLREEPFELLLTDIVMPEMDGIEL